MNFKWKYRFPEFEWFWSITNWQSVCMVQHVILLFCTYKESPSFTWIAARTYSQSGLFDMNTLLQEKWLSWQIDFTQYRVQLYTEQLHMNCGSHSNRVLVCDNIKQIATSKYQCLQFISSVYSREDGCYQCLLMIQRHKNLIQYKESKYLSMLNA